MRTAAERKADQDDMARPWNSRVAASIAEAAYAHWKCPSQTAASAMRAPAGTRGSGRPQSRQPEALYVLFGWKADLPKKFPLASQTSFKPLASSSKLQSGVLETAGGTPANIEEMI